MENKIQKTTLHPVGDDSVDLYPKTSTDQITDLAAYLNKQGLTSKPFVVGHVKTLPANAQANVTFTEQNDKIAINFAIPRGDVGAQGNAGPEGREGPVGPRGPSGNDFQIKLQVDSVSELPAASSAYLGWAAYVGTEAPRDVYTCVEITDGVIAWENQGKLQGAKGEDGNSIEGFTLVKHEVVGNETYNTIQASYSDKPSSTFEVHVQNGRDGVDGTNGVEGPAGPKGDQGAPLYWTYLFFEGKTSVSVHAEHIKPSNPPISVGDLCLSADGWVAEVTSVGDPLTVMKSLYSIKGPRGLQGPPGPVSPSTPLYNHFITIKKDTFPNKLLLLFNVISTRQSQYDNIFEIQNIMSIQSIKVSGYLRSEASAGTVDVISYYNQLTGDDTMTLNCTIFNNFLSGVTPVAIDTQNHRFSDVVTEIV